jgi:transcriptional regulator with XRE-family HTH domain
MADPKGFGGRVLWARLQLAARRGRPVTQTEVAERMKVTQGTVGRWESAAKEPGLATIAQLAKVLEVDPRWLAFGGEVNQPKEPDVPQKEKGGELPPMHYPGTVALTEQQLREETGPKKRTANGGGRKR